MRERFYGAVALLGFLFVTGSPLFSQKQEYDMSLAGKKIGTLVTEKRVKGDVTIYTLNSSANAEILWKKVATATSYSVTVKDGIVIESYFEHKENGETTKYCRIKKKDDAVYDAHHWKQGKYTFGPISKSCLISTMYYSEPQDGFKMFNEGWGTYSDIKRKDNGVYEFKAPDGGKNVYKYSNGKLIEAEFITSIVTIRVKPKV